MEPIDNFENEEGQKIKLRINKYDVKFKLKVVEMLNNGISLHKIENKWNIDRHTLWKWREQESDLKLVNKKDNRFRKNRIGGIHKNFSDIQENEICNFIANARKNNLAVSTKSVICFASKINIEFSNKKTLTKLKWCYRFLKRNGFSIRRVSHQGQKIPNNMIQLKEEFINQVIANKKKMDILYDEADKIINMDETPCALDIGFDTTIDFIGKKNIDIQTSGREHYKISIILSITGSGIKLPPLVIVKGEPGKSTEKELCKLYNHPEECIYIYAQKDGWWTTFIFKEWINNAFKKYEKNLGCKCLLIMDKASSHISKESINFLVENNISYNLIPSGLTPILRLYISVLTRYLKII